MNELSSGHNKQLSKWGKLIVFYINCFPKGYSVCGVFHDLTRDAYRHLVKCAYEMAMTPSNRHKKVSAEKDQVMPIVVDEVQATLDQDESST